MTKVFNSWDGVNDLSGTVEQQKLEAFFGPTAVAFNSYQNAIASILEVLGTKTTLIPVVLPITTSPAVLAGVLRAGADPILLDIKPQTLQIDPALLKEVLDEIKTAVVVLSRPAGQPIDPALLELSKDMPTILDSKLPPHKGIDVSCQCSFNVFDLESIVGTGSIVIHKYEEQVKDLKLVRNGLLGLSANLNELLSAGALKRLTADADLVAMRSAQKTKAEYFAKTLSEKLVVPFIESKEWPYFILRVENAGQVIAHLHSYGLVALKPVFPLHLLSEINRRWQEKPSYPVAEDLTNKLVALPTHQGVLPEAYYERIMEII